MVKYTIGDALKEGIALLNKNNIESAGTDARILMEYALGCDGLYLVVHRSDIIDKQEADLFFALVGRRAQNEPVAYIVKNREFMSLDFYVDENVLIPRPDTEILCERIISVYKDKNVSILDMCTGSGAIAVALAKYIPRARVLGIDISEKALKVARFNSEKNGTSQNCSFALHDAAKPFDRFKADCVVSNPPYIPTGDIEFLEKNVRDFEPRLALDGGDDGMYFYRSILKNIHFCLKSGGILAFEVGCGLAYEVSGLMKNDFYEIEIINDLAGMERVVTGIYK